MRNKLVSVIAVFTPVIMVFGILLIRNLNKKEVQIMPYSVGLCTILTILFLTMMFLLKKRFVNPVLWAIFSKS